MKFVFGPVNSRRLGLSLGVEVVPEKYCSLNCRYCESGKTNFLTNEVKSYVPKEKLIEELKQKIPFISKIDWITITGAGEPTLNQDIEEIIEIIKSEFNHPVCVLTNGTLLYKEEIRERLMKADLVIPSIDTADEKTFQNLLLPHKEISLDKTLKGIKDFSLKYDGQLWIEIIVVKGYNDNEEEMHKILNAIKEMRVDRVYIGTVYRPPAFDIEGISPEKIEAFKKIFQDADYDTI